MTLDDMRGKPCWMGLDLASKVDIAALELLFEIEPGRYARFGKYYLPKRPLTSRKTSTTASGATPAC